MASPELIEYIKNELNAGIGEDVIKQTLLGVGWGQSDIDTTFAAAKSQKLVNPNVKDTTHRPIVNKLLTILLGLIFLSVIIVVGIVAFQKLQNAKTTPTSATNQQSTIDNPTLPVEQVNYSSKEECEKATGKPCQAYLK